MDTARKRARPVKGEPKRNEQEETLPLSAVRRFRVAGALRFARSHMWLSVTRRFDLRRGSSRLAGDFTLRTSWNWLTTPFRMELPKKKVQDSLLFVL